MPFSHSAYLLAVAVPAAAAGAQARLVEFKISEAQQQGHAVHVPSCVRGQRHLQAQQVGRCWLRFKLALQGRLEQAGRQEAAAQTGAEQLHVDSVGEVAEPPHQGPFETLQPLLQGLGIGGQGS